VAFFEPSEEKCPKSRSAVTATHTYCFHRLHMGIHAGSNPELCAIQSKGYGETRQSIEICWRSARQQKK
jgi:hypothetical protein